MLAVATEVAHRLRDRRLVESAVDATRAQTAFPRSARWQPASLAQGDAGVALVCGYLDACFPDGDWDQIGHDYLTMAALDAQRRPRLPLSMFGGLAGVGFTAWSLSKQATRYQRLLSEIDATVIGSVAGLAKSVARQTEGMSFSDFDVISGLAGVGAYLLSRLPDRRESGPLELVLQALVTLADSTGGRPRWWNRPK